MRPRKYQKNRILDEARKRFLRSGFSKVTVDHLVKHLRISKSTVYEYFPTKDDMVRAVIDQLNREINDELESIVEDTALSFCEKLEKVIQFTRKNLSMVSENFLDDMKSLTPEIWKYYEKERTDRIDRFYRKLFENGINDGHIRRDINMEILLAVYLQLTEITVNADLFIKHDISNSQLYDEITRFFLEGALSKH